MKMNSLNLKWSKWTFQCVLLAGLSAGFFASCTDYSEDISSLENRLEAVENDVDAIKTKIEAGETITSVESTSTGLKITMSNGDTYNIDNGIDGQAGSVVEIGANGNWTIDGVDTGKPSQGAAGANGTGTPGAAGADGAVYTPNADGYWYKDGVATTEKWLLDDVVTAVVDSETGIVTLKVDGKDYVLANNSAILSGLVFEPQAYLNGVEALGVKTLDFNKWTLHKSDTPTTEVGEIWKNGGNVVYTQNKIVAYYHLNPTNIDPKQIKEASFLSADREFIGTRAAAFDPQVDTCYVDGEKLKVIFDVKPEFIEAVNSNKISTFAVQVTVADAKGEDTVITSDYAAIYATAWTNFNLKFKEGVATVAANAQGLINKNATTRGRSLYGTDNTGGLKYKAQDAIDNAVNFNLYNTESASAIQTLDLNGYYTFSYTDETGAAKEFTGTDAQLADLGLEFVLSTSNYHSGDNKTKQNDFLTFNNGVVNSRVFDTFGSGALNREPIVHVELIHSASGSVLTAGWVGLRIIEKPAVVQPSTDFEATYREFDANIYLGCSAWTDSLNVEFMNEEIYTPLGLTYDQFRKYYALDVTKTNATTNGVGTISEYVNDSNPDRQTTVPRWDLSEDNLWDYATNVAGLTKDIYYTPTTAGTAAGIKRDVIIHIKADPANFKIYSPKGTSIDKEIKEYWSSDFSYFRVNATVPFTGSTSMLDQQNDDCQMKQDIYAVFEGNKVTINGVDSRFVDFEAVDLTTSFEFDAAKMATMNPYRDVDGNAYTLTVSPNGKAVLNGLETIATITESGTATNPIAIVELINDTKAEELLNVTGHNDLAGSFTLPVKLIAKNTCDRVLPIDGSTFDVKFLRPLDVAKDAAAGFTDGLDNGDDQNLADVIDFTDWRDKAFITGAVNYYNHYGVKSITVDAAGIKTDMNGNDIATTFLSDVTTQIKLTQTAATPAQIAAGNFGKLTYENNGSPVEDFTLRIPVAIGYKWGTVKVEIDVPVKATIANPGE